MNPTSTENDPLLKMVARLDPAPSQLPAPAVVQKRELFDQLVAAEASLPQPPAVNAQPDDLADRRQQRRRRFLPGVIAAALILVAGTVLFAVSRAPSAEALLMQAVERTTQFDAGRAEVDIEIREPFVINDFKLDYVFDGEDFRLDTIIDRTLAFSELGVDGVQYLGNTFGDGEVVWSENSPLYPFPGFLEGLSAADADPETVLPLIDLADDLEVTSTAAGDIYRGTISRSDLLAQPEIPAGIALVTSGSDPGADLPETLVLTVHVVDDLIQELELFVEGDVPAGEFVSATITTTYTEYGQSQDLSAPAVVTELPGVPGTEDNPSEVVALPPDAALPLWAPGPEPQTPAEVTLAEVLQRRPRLCFEAGRSPIPRTLDQEFYDEIQASVVACFMSAGELDAANAVGAMTFNISE